MAQSTMTREKEGQRSVAVVGGGLVGSLQASLLAKRGFNVNLYESRADIRSMTHVSGRSINLALSTRGREALKAVGLEATVLQDAIPMYSRMIHSVSGSTSTQPYGTKEQCIYSVDRRRLNEQLLTLAESHDNVSLHFSHKLTRADFTKCSLEFSTPNESFTVATEFVFGCDGAYSTLRRQMMRYGRLNYEQEYIEHGYKELCLPPLPDGDYALPPNHLHIWPRNEFMMIALPNTDHSFTVTLFMPFLTFENIRNEFELLTFFEEHFPDSLDILGRDNLTKEFFSNPTGQVISVKCYPHFLGGCAVLLGDAAHAVVPFYGQGMNAGFEDCLIFYELLLAAPQDDIVQAAQCYSDTHWRDCHAIADLSKYNYLEMRSHVNSRWFLLLKTMDSILHWLLPRVFIPLYSMVAFSRIPYHQVVLRSQRQRRLITIAMVTSGVSVLVCVVCVAMERSGAYNSLRYRILPCVAGCVLKDFYQQVTGSS